MKRVLMVSYFCPPVPGAESFLVWKTMRELCLRHELTVLTADIGIKRIDPLLDIPPAVAVMRAPDPQFRNSFMNRAGGRALGWVTDETRLWAIGAAAAIRGQRFDAIYSRSQPGASHIVALAAKRRLGVPWVAQFSDPWASNPYHSGHTGLRVRHNRKYEALTVRLADKLVFPTKELLEMYERLYPSLPIAAKSVVLPHHTSPDLYHKQEYHLDRQPGKINVVYSGDFYGARSPYPILQACRLLRERRPDLADRLHLHFFGNIQPSFAPMVQQSVVPVSTGRVGYLESLNAMTQADMLLLLDAPNESGKTPFLPSKLIDYLGAGRPIFGITQAVGTTPDILREYGYPVVDPLAVDDIAAELERWLTNVPQVSPKSTDEFSTATVVGRLAELFD